MKTFLSQIIPSIAQYSNRLDNLTILTNQHWVVIDEIQNSKSVYIFRTNNQLLISRDGKVTKGKWELIGDTTLLIDVGDESYLMKHGFLDDAVLALKMDGKEEYAFFVNEKKALGELNSHLQITDFLSSKYLGPSVSKLLHKDHPEITEPVLLPRDVVIKQEIETEKQNIYLYTNLLYTVGGLAVFVIFLSFFWQPLISCIILVPGFLSLIAISSSKKSKGNIKNLEEELNDIMNS